MTQLCHGIPPVEPAEAALERELIAHYLAPYREMWDTLPAEEQRRLRSEASTWASLMLTDPKPRRRSRRG